jgi:hypothetical protein
MINSPRRKEIHRSPDKRRRGQEDAKSAEKNKQQMTILATDFPGQNAPRTLH